MKELLTYLQGVNDWETFGYLLLPVDKAHLIEVFSLSYIHSYVHIYLLYSFRVVLATILNEIFMS